MSIVKRTVLIGLAAVINLGAFPLIAISETSQGQLCPNPFPKNYKSPRKTKYIKVPELDIAVKVPIDQRLVMLDLGKRFAFMTPPEYKSYQCSLSKKDAYGLPAKTYLKIDNPKKLPLTTAVSEFISNQKNDPELVGRWLSPDRSLPDKLRVTCRSI